MPETLKSHDIVEVVTENWQFFAGLIIIGLAFSKKVRKEILDRDGHKSIFSGETENLHACHADHDKSKPWYNTKDNGFTATREEHYIDHRDRHDNGLNSAQNSWAIRLLKRIARIEE